MEILKVNNLSKVYGKGDTQIKALDDVNFSVEKGEFVAIVGPSGSGKSTLLHILGGVDTPSSGQVLVDGTDICALDQTKLAIFRRRQIGLIYQFYNLIPILNVEENITLPLLLDERSLDEARLKEIVATLGLADRVSHLLAEAPRRPGGGQPRGGRPRGRRSCAGRCRGCGIWTILHAPHRPWHRHGRPRVDQLRARQQDADYTRDVL